MNPGVTGTSVVKSTAFKTEDAAGAGGAAEPPAGAGELPGFGTRRSRYYSRLRSFIKSGSTESESGKQSSAVTIFAIWNTMIGSSLLTLPWVVERAGLTCSLLLMVAMGALCLYTAYLLLQVQQLHGVGNVNWGTAEMTGYLLGRPYEHIANVSSLVMLVGTLIMYWIIISNSLYNSVDFIHHKVYGVPFGGNQTNETQPSLLCPANASVVSRSLLFIKLMKDDTPSSATKSSTYDKIWNLQKTVPLFLNLIIAPLINFKSSLFFTKFSSLGTLSLGYLLVFIMVKSGTWGLNFSSSSEFEPVCSSNFPTLTGTLSLSFIIHNIVVIIMRNNRHQEKNGRDLTIAFVLVTSTYLIVGNVFYLGFPLNKRCIQDNFLDNFHSWDPMTVVARMFLFVQLLAVYPIYAFMVRVQIFSAVMKKIYPGFFYVLLLNAALIAICVIFTLHLPFIGTISRFTGALTGFVYIYALPSILHLVSLHKRSKLTVLSTLGHVAIIVAGFINLVAQFFVS